MSERSLRFGGAHDVRLGPADRGARPVTGPLDGVRVVEVATHVFVPMATALLAEWGATVVKVEEPVRGDPYRGLVTSGLHNVHHGYDPFFQSANRGKQSVGLDLSQADGRDLLRPAAGDGRRVRHQPPTRRRRPPRARRRARPRRQPARRLRPGHRLRQPRARCRARRLRRRCLLGPQRHAAPVQRPRRGGAVTHPPGVRRRRGRSGPGRRRRHRPVPTGGVRRAVGDRLVPARQRHVADRARRRQRRARRRPHPPAPRRPVRGRGTR